eukprot:7166257-Pyramimonas_sp.AAC.3
MREPDSGSQTLNDNAKPAEPNAVIWFCQNPLPHRHRLRFESSASRDISRCEFPGGKALQLEPAYAGVKSFGHRCRPG